MTTRTGRLLSRRWRLALVALVVVALIGLTAVWTNALGAGDRFERLLARIDLIVDPPPDRPTVPTVVITAAPSSITSSEPTATEATPTEAAATSPPPSAEPTLPIALGLPSQAPPPPTPLPPTAAPPPAPDRVPVNVTIVADHNAVFTSQNTTEMCAVAGTQMVLTILGLGSPGEAFQNELAGRIGEWESWEDSHDGGWGPAAVSQALAAYGAPGYELRAYASYTDALRDSSIAISTIGKPVVMFPWWGAHTWVMTGYAADADPTIFPDATITGAYILDPWYPRVSSIWGPSDAPGNFEPLAELERNWPVGTPMGFGPGWSRPEGAYPDRDGRFVVLIPTY